MSDAKALAKNVLEGLSWPDSANVDAWLPTLAHAYLDLLEKHDHEQAQADRYNRKWIESEKQLDAKQKVINAKNRDLDYKLEQLDAASAEVEWLTEELSDSEMRCDTLCRVNSAGKKQVENLRIQHGKEIRKAKHWALETTRVQHALTDARAEVERLTREHRDFVRTMRANWEDEIRAMHREVERLRGALKDLVTYFTDNGAGGTVIERARAALGREGQDV